MQSVNRRFGRAVRALTDSAGLRPHLSGVFCPRRRLASGRRRAPQGSHVGAIPHLFFSKNYDPNQGRDYFSALYTWSPFVVIVISELFVMFLKHCLSVFLTHCLPFYPM